MFSKTKKYIKEEDKVYCDLLKLSCISDNRHYNEQSLTEIVNTFEQLPHYLTIHQRILPLLNAKANKLGVLNQLSKETQQILISANQQGVITELAKMQQLTELVKLFTAHHIPVILLKGVAFNHYLYSSSAPRTSTDIDILVKQTDWQQCVALMSQLMDYSEKAQPDVFGDLYELSFKPKKKIGAALDLHMSLTYPKLFSINERGLWEASEIHPYFDNTQVRMLSPEHAIVHQAIHAYRDMNFCKYNLVDSHELITQKKVDIEKAIYIAKGWGSQAALYQLLKNCQQFILTDIAKDLLIQIKPSYIRGKLMQMLLNSRFNQPYDNKKTVRYRINQLLSQFVFTSSIRRPLSFQWLFIKTVMKQNKKKSQEILTL